MTEFIEFKIDVLNSKVYIVVCDNFREAGEFINKKYNLNIAMDDIESKNTKARCYCCSMLVIFYKRKYLNINVITHEMLHAVRCILDSARDILLVHESEEMYAYMMGYCMEQFFKRYNKLKKAEFLLKRLL